MEIEAVNISTLAVVVALMMNFGALIWGAATLSTTVKYQGTQLERIARQLNKAASLLNDLEGRVRVLESSDL
jgi:hypothetical protein